LAGYQKRFLKARAHTLEATLACGRQGVTESWLAELDRELDRHELVKVRLSGERDLRGAEVAQVLDHTGALLVGTVGRVATLYRPSATAEDPIVIPRRSASAATPTPR
jgi:RNA-binding protein